MFDDILDIITKVCVKIVEVLLNSVVYWLLGGIILALFGIDTDWNFFYGIYCAILCAIIKINIKWGD